MNTLAKLVFPIAAMAIAAPGMALADAKQDFQEKCAVCHGAGGQGNGPFAEFLKQGAPNLAVLSANNGGEFPIGKVTAAITVEVKGHGTREMILWGKAMTAAEVSAMVSYLKSIQAK